MISAGCYYCYYCSTTVVYYITTSITSLSARSCAAKPGRDPYLLGNRLREATIFLPRSLTRTSITSLLLFTNSTYLAATATATATATAAAAATAATTTTTTTTFSPLFAKTTPKMSFAQ